LFFNHFTLSLNAQIYNLFFIFGHLAEFRSVIWPVFVRSFGRFSFGHFRSVIWPDEKNLPEKGGITNFVSRNNDIPAQTP